MELKQLEEEILKEFDIKKINHTKDDGFVKGVIDYCDVYDLDTDLIKSFILSAMQKSELAVLKKVRIKLPKELEIWQLKSFPVGKDCILDSETLPIAIENVKNMRDNRYENGFNECLSTITKSLDELENELTNHQTIK